MDIFDGVAEILLFYGLPSVEQLNNLDKTAVSHYKDVSFPLALAL